MLRNKIIQLEEIFNFQPKEFWAILGSFVRELKKKEVKKGSFREKERSYWREFKIRRRGGIRGDFESKVFERFFSSYLLPFIT